MNLACVMYSADADDVFPLTNRAIDDGYGAMVWMLDVYPYTKSYDMFLNPQGPPNPVDNKDWKYIGGTYGTIPNPVVKGIPYYTVADFPITRALGVVGARQGGIMGVGNHPTGSPLFGRGCFGRCEWIGPSKSQTQLSDVANHALVFDAGEPTADYTTFAAGTELGTCVAGREGYNPGGTTIAGATPRWNGGPKSCAGWRNPGSAGISVENANKVKTGSSNIGFADGHVKSMNLTQLYRIVPCRDDTTKSCMVHFPLD
jgi:prepilin-type processing-associated H-X9-DG protein